MQTVNNPNRRYIRSESDIRALTPEEMRDRAVEMHRFYDGPPALTLAQVGDKYGVTKERVRQIFKQYDLPIRFPRPRKHDKESQPGDQSDYAH